MSDLTRKLMTVLTPREGMVVRRLFGIPDGNEETLEEIAKKRGTSISEVQKIRARALQKLRRFLPKEAVSALIPESRNLFEKMMLKIARVWLKFPCGQRI